MDKQIGIDFIKMMDEHIKATSSHEIVPNIQFRPQQYQYRHTLEIITSNSDWEPNYRLNYGLITSSKNLPEVLQKAKVDQISPYTIIQEKNMFDNFLKNIEQRLILFTELELVYKNKMLSGVKSFWQIKYNPFVQSDSKFFDNHQKVKNQHLNPIINHLNFYGSLRYADRNDFNNKSKAFTNDILNYQPLK